MQLSPSAVNYLISLIFDCVVMMGVLEHVLDERKTLEDSQGFEKGGAVYIYGLNKGLFGFWILEASSSDSLSCISFFI